jgi:hypothetical protein
MKLQGRVSFSFYAIDHVGEPDIVINLAGSIEHRKTTEPDECKSVLVMVGGSGPSADQLTAMAKLAKGCRGSTYSGPATKFATSVSAIRSLLPDSEAISLEP